jgi:hypothetical protein
MLKSERLPRLRGVDVFTVRDGKMGAKLEIRWRQLLCQLDRGNRAKWRFWTEVYTVAAVLAAAWLEFGTISGIIHPGRKCHAKKEFFLFVHGCSRSSVRADVR